MKIVIAVSGGMDSLYTLMHLKQEGHDVAALHARFISTKNDPVPALSALCKEWNIPFHIADLRDEFRKEVIIPFLNSYAHGETPNPCAICNRRMKFGRLLDIARNLSAEVLATGHYVDMENYKTEKGIDYGLCLKCGDDKSKDQSYFLALTPIENLRFALFPLAHKIKTDIYDELTKKSVPIPISKESQEICFVPHDNYKEFIEVESQKYKIAYQNTGEIIYRDAHDDALSGKKIGMHEGLWRYTEGQRKGLGIAWAEPLYVIEKNYNSNILYVGNQSALNISEASASQINFLVLPQLFPKNLFVRTRFREHPVPAKVFLAMQNSNVEIELGNSLSEKALTRLLDELQGKSKTCSNSATYSSNDTCLTSNESESFSIPSQLFHVREEGSRLDSEQEQAFSKQRTTWNTAPISLIVRFENHKQIYAKGQVLAVYDENGFVLAGGVLE